MAENFSKIQALLLRVMRRDPARWWFTLDVLEACIKEDPKAKLGQRNLYPSLRSLEHEGFLESRDETIEEQTRRFKEEGRDTRGGRKRRLYRVSDQGRKVPISNSEGRDFDVLGGFEVSG